MSSSFGWGMSRRINRPDNQYHYRSNNTNWDNERDKGRGGNRNNTFRIRKEFRGNSRKITRVNHNNNNYKRKSDGASDGLTWFRAVIPKFHNCNKKHLMDQIQNLVGPVILYYFHMEKDQKAICFVSGAENADALKACSRRICDLGGLPLLVYVSEHVGMPIVPLTYQTEQQIVEALRRRFNLDHKFLDLSDFAHEPGLLESNLYLPLSRETVLMCVIKKIKDHFSDIVALGLSNNRLSSLRELSHLATSCHELKALDLSNNKIKRVEDLDHLKSLDLHELIIEGNFFANVFTETDRITLTSAIRSKFPKLVKLDRVDLPPSIGFEVPEGEIPPLEGNFVPLPIKDFVGEFLEAFFKIYDSQDRTSLLAAYHDHASFSYSVTGQKQDKSFISSLISGSRNLMRIRDDSDQRVTLLHQGNRAIVEALKKLPQTKHSGGVMSVDVPFSIPELYTIVINGIFKEFTKKQAHTRAFVRTFVIIPHGKGFVIINDILIITNATVEQVQKFVRTLDQRSIKECVMGDRLNIGSLAGLSLGGEMESNIMENDREQTIVKFMKLTGMNRQFSTQCLDENGFDLNKSFEVYSLLQANSQIPPEAFF